MVNFNADSVNTVYDQLVSHAQSLGVFDAGVNAAESWSTPGDGVWCMFSAPAIVPLPGESGLAAVSGRLDFKALIGCSANIKPLGRADKVILAAACSLLAAYSGAFTLGGNVKDLNPLLITAAPHYLTMEGHTFRVYEITLPVVVNDLWVEAS
jgi:hypothetical protein